jgi:hypothetical protein
MASWLVQIRKRWRLLAALVVVVYAGSYAVYRTKHLILWDADGYVYVVFPADSRLAYYFYRPLEIVDGLVTGIHFHIGPLQ